MEFKPEHWQRKLFSHLKLYGSKKFFNISKIKFYLNQPKFDVR